MQKIASLSKEFTLKGRLAYDIRHFETSVLNLGAGFLRIFKIHSSF